VDEGGVSMDMPLELVCMPLDSPMFAAIVDGLILATGVGSGSVHFCMAISLVMM
jgi:hypothetical protein